MAPGLSRLRDLTESSLEELTAIALVIRTVHASQQHVGILYKDPDDATADVQLLDLQWHHALVSDRPRFTSRYLWVVPAYEPEVAYVLAKLCSRIADEYARGGRRLAFALRYAGERFDPGAGIFMAESGCGLTCATFVMAVFASHGVPLLRWTDWREREEDRPWQEYIVKQLRAHGAKEEHIEAVNAQAILGCARYRPEEVAAAGVSNELPLGFAEAERVGKLIVAKLSLPASPRR